jgi:flagellar biosynthetic protein FliR
MYVPIESLEHLQVFFWVLLRLSVLIFLLPLFGARGFPALWKAGVSMVLAIVITPVAPVPNGFPQSTPEIMVAAAGEFILGLSLALGVRILFFSVQLAGQFMGFQMGFSIAGAIDPQEGGQSTALSQFLYIFTVLIFLAMDGHHLFIRALARSFEVVPVTAFTWNPNLADVVLRTSGEMFFIALKIAAPILVALFLSNLCLGIVARTVPQVNILMIGFPVNIGIGFVVLGMTMSQITPFLADLTRGMGHLMFRMINLMAVGHGG